MKRRAIVTGTRTRIGAFRHTSKDGHDQMPLRKVLYRHRNDVYDLPARVQRRGLSHSPCEGEPLLWHAHRSDRVKWARIHKHGAAEVCGFVV